MIPELETHRPCYLFDYPYPELLTCKEPVVDEQGMLWAGKDRKTEMQSDAYRKSLWRAWQQSFKTRKYFPAQDAMDYFQATKHLSRPPQGGDTTLGTGQPLKPVNVPPVFTWSPSKIMTFDTCPYQFAATYYYKTVPYTETVATKWGTRVHEEAERYMKGQASADPGAFKVVEKWVKVLDKVQGERFIEYRMGVDENLKEAKWTEAEGRMILDLGILNGEELRLYDWKTGRMKPDDTQMKIYALIMALRLPQVQKISYRYIWLKDGTTTGDEVTRKELLPIAKELKAKLNRMKDAWNTESWRQVRNGLCRSYCGAKECEHCGR